MNPIALSPAVRQSVRALAAAGYRGTVLALDPGTCVIAVLDVQPDRIRYLAIIRAGAMPADASGLLSLPGLQFGEMNPYPERALRAAIDAAKDAGLEVDLAPVAVVLQ